MSNRKQILKTIFNGIALAVVCLAPAGAVYAAICTSTGSTAWGLASTWTSTGNCGHVPLAGLAGDDVVIASGHTVTVNGAAGCKSLSTSGNSSSGVVISAGGLTVSGDAVLNATSINNNNSKTINVGAGTLTIGGNLTLTNGTGSRTAVLSMSTGTAYIGGSLSGGGTLTPGTGTVVYNGAGAQNVGGYTYNHLNLSGSGNKSAGAGLTVNGDLTIDAGATFLGNSHTHSLKGNLSNSGTLTGGTSTFIFNGTAAQSISGATNFFSLTMDNAAGLTLDNTVAVDGTLTLSSGNIATGATNALVITSTGSVTRTSGHVVGNMTRHFTTGIDVMQNFEIGTGTDYTPVLVTIAEVITAGSMTATTTTPDHPQVTRASIDSTKSVNRYWTLSKDGNLAFDALSAVFNFVSGDIDAGSNTDNFIVQRYVEPDWINTTLIAPLKTSTEAGNIIALGDFVVGQSIVGFSHEKEFVFIREIY